MTGYWRQVALDGSTGAAQRHTQSLAVRERILLAAGAEFARHGFRAVALSAIAERADVPRGSLTNHFASKKALARAVMASSTQRLDAIRADVGKRRLDPLAMLISEINAIVGELRRDDILHGGLRLVNDFDIGTDADRMACALGDGAVTEHLRLAERAGLLGPNVVAEVAARQIVSLVAGHTAAQAGQSDPEALRTRMREAWQLLLPVLAGTEWLSRCASLLPASELFDPDGLCVRPSDSANCPERAM